MRWNRSILGRYFEWMPKLQTLTEMYQKTTKQGHMTSKGGKTNETRNPAATIVITFFTILEQCHLSPKRLGRPRGSQWIHMQIRRPLSYLQTIIFLNSVLYSLPHWSFALGGNIPLWNVAWMCSPSGYPGSPEIHNGLSICENAKCWRSLKSPESRSIPVSCLFSPEKYDRNFKKFFGKYQDNVFTVRPFWESLTINLSSIVIHEGSSTEEKKKIEPQSLLCAPKSHIGTAH